MSWRDEQKAEEELEKALMDAIPEHDKARAIMQAIKAYMSARIDDLDDKMNKRGIHDPDW